MIISSMSKQLENNKNNNTRVIFAMSYFCQKLFLQQKNKRKTQTVRRKGNTNN